MRADELARSRWLSVSALRARDSRMLAKFPQSNQMPGRKLIPTLRITLHHLTP